MHVLDPMEVAALEVWPYWQYQNVKRSDKQAMAQMRDTLSRAEYTVYTKLVSESAGGRLLNEKVPLQTATVDLPASHRFLIVPSEIHQRLNHPDERIARRSLTIANLAQVIKERDVSAGLRQTLVTQADRLQRIARERYEQVMGETPSGQLAKELLREGPEEDASNEETPNGESPGGS